MCVSRAGAERERRIQSRLLTASMEPDVGFKLTDREIMTEWKPRVGHLTDRATQVILEWFIVVVVVVVVLIHLHMYLFFSK